MKVCIRQAFLADPRSEWYGQQVDILINDSRIEAIGPALDFTADEIIAHPNLTVAPGFTDIFTQTGDPGMEYKETLETAAAAAQAGGYTRVMVLPNTQPAVYTKSQVSYIVQKSLSLPVQMLPMGAITRQCEGKDLAEMFDMHLSGAVAFSDGIHPVQNSQVLLKALQYVKAFNGTIIQIPDDTNLSRTGLINEGIISTQLGLPGKPVLAETLMLARDIELLRYTGSRLHVTGISSAASVELVRRAKNDGLHITCSVTPYHLYFSDEDLVHYDTHLKVNPPLRTPADREALRAAVLDGTIDCIASHHQPHEWDSKVCEFEYARYGMEGLESALGATLAALPQLQPADIARLFALAPASIFGLPLPAIAVGAPAYLTLFYRAHDHIFHKEAIRSLSSNNAFTGKNTGAVIMRTFNNLI